MNSIKIASEIFIGWDGLKNFVPYYTSSSWSQDENLFYFFCESGGQAWLCVHDLRDGRHQKILHLSFLDAFDERAREGALVTSTFLAASKLLVIPRGPEIFSVHVETGKIEILGSFDSSLAIGGVLHSDKTGRFITGGLYPPREGKPVALYQIGATNPQRTFIFIFDTVTKKMVLQKDIPFFATHFQFFENGKEILFAHEGATETIPDRLNVMSVSNGDFRCVHRQQKNHSGELIEYVGHEMVAGDQLVAVRYPVSKMEFGIIRVDPATGLSELLDQDDYWHASADAGGNRFAMDTMWWGNSRRREEGVVDIIVFNRLTGQKQILKTIFADTQSQAYHPHPHFSPLGNKLVFSAKGSLDKKNREVKLVHQTFH